MIKKYLSRIDYMVPKSATINRQYTPVLNALFFFLSFFFCSFGHSACSLEKDLTKLHIEDRQIKDEYNRVIILHGLNLVNKQKPYTPSSIGFDDKSMELMEKYGFNIVRLGFVWAGFQPSYGQYNTRYLDDYQKTVEALAKRRIYSLIDFHEDAYSAKHGGFGFPEWAALSNARVIKHFAFPLLLFFNKATKKDFDNFWNNTSIHGKGLQDHYSDMIKAVVSRFKNNPAVIGYDIMNEPFPGSSWPECFDGKNFFSFLKSCLIQKNCAEIEKIFKPDGCADFDKIQLTSFYSKIIQAIQTIDPKTLIFYEPISTFGLGMVSSIPPLGYKNLVFGFHNYASTFETVFKNAISYTNTTNTVPFMTEFGADLLTGPELTRISALADKYKMSWIEWAYSNNPNYPISHLPLQAPPDAKKQGIVYDPSKALKGSNINCERLLALSRPYPQITAGELIDYNYDAQNKKFTLSFNKRDKDKKIISKNPCSIIYVPAFRYKNGYDLRVEGAKISSQTGNYIIIENSEDDNLDMVSLSITAKEGADEQSPCE